MFVTTQALVDSPTMPLSPCLPNSGSLDNTLLTDRPGETMASCELTSEDKKAYGKEVGEILVKNHGKKEFYSPEEVKTASSRSRFAMDWHC